MTWKSERNPMFRIPYSETMFYQKYALSKDDTWEALSYRLIHEVCDGLMNPSEIDALVNYHTALKVVFGGRYLYYAGRGRHFYNNCFLFRSEDDSREDWARIVQQAMLALASGGGIGNDYSVYRPEGAPIRGTDGVASGPISMMHIINDLGRGVMQGGSRRSAIYASLDRKHPDIWKFLKAKDWHSMEVVPGLTYAQAKAQNFTFNAPLDFTNISVNYGTDWLKAERTGDFHSPEQWVGDDRDPVFLANVRQAMETGEPGFSFNFFDKERETLRNACTEVCSEDDSDVCNLGSINLGRVEDLQEFNNIVYLATKFLVCGTLRAELPYAKVYEVREKNRRLGLGLMGVHEWLLKRGYGYEVTTELRQWLGVYRMMSQRASEIFSDKLGISRPVATRAIAPTGSIGILAATTTGIEPMFAPAYKRRYLKGTEWRYQYVVEPVAQHLAEVHGKDVDDIEGAYHLAADPERRIAFQADVQDYVDQSISSTINLPQWGSERNNEDHVGDFASVLARYASRLRGFTAYPDGARGGQPLSVVRYSEVRNMIGQEFTEVVAHDVCDLTNRGGSCGA